MVGWSVGRAVTLLYLPVGVVLMVLEVILVVLGVVLVFLGAVLGAPSKQRPLKLRPHYSVIDHKELLLIYL